MSLKLRQDSFSTFLTDRAADLSNIPQADPDGMCILSGQILRENVKEYLNRENIATNPLARFTTIEELASDLLNHTSEPSGMLQEGIRDRLIKNILLAADPEINTHNLEGIDSSGRLDADEKNAIERLALHLPYENKDSREILLNELDDYLRWTDATHMIQRPQCRLSDQLRAGLPRSKLSTRWMPSEGLFVLLMIVLTR